VSVGPGTDAGPRGASITRGDRLLLGTLVAVLGLVATLSPIRNYDYWWHLRTGALVVEQGQVPRADPYSFTAAGTPWVDHEWLFQVLAWAAHERIGPAALVLLKAALVLGLLFLASRLLEREGHGPAGRAFLLTIAIVGSAFRIDVRPELVTLLLVPLSVHLAMAGRVRGRIAPLALVVGLCALGANMHVGVILVPAILLAGALATALRAALVTSEAGERRFAARLFATGALAAVAVGLNPWGFELYRVPFRVRDVLGSLPWPNLEWVPPTFASTPLFFIVLVLAALILLAGLRHADPVGAPALAIAGALGLAHVRNVGLFFILVPWGLARPARALVETAKRHPLYQRVTGRESVRPGFITAVAVLVGGVPLLFLLPPRPALGIGMAADNEPAAAADFLEREGVGRRLYNDVRFGGYLIWRRFPGRRVFVDGRNEIYGDLMRDIDHAMQGPDAWKAFLDGHGIDAAFLRYPPSLQKVQWTGADGRPHQGVRAFSVAYFPASEWALVYWDDDALVMVRRTPEQAALIDRLEYHSLNPDDWQFLYASVLIGRLHPAPIVGEIRRKLREDPDCQRAADLLRRFGPLADAAAAAGIAPDAPGGPVAEAPTPSGHGR
jgi:hypothetical protein